MGNYITPGMELPNYYQFPQFLLKAPISQTAKHVYMLLYDRMRENEMTIEEIRAQIPIVERLTLTAKEAAAYSNIGINKIESLLKPS